MITRTDMLLVKRELMADLLELLGSPIPETPRIAGYLKDLIRRYDEEGAEILGGADMWERAVKMASGK